VRQVIESAVHPIGNGQTLRVTISLGCATLGGKSAFILPEDLLASADKALYAAKRGGRNQAIAFESLRPAAGSAVGAIKRSRSKHCVPQPTAPSVDRAQEGKRGAAPT